MGDTDSDLVVHTDRVHSHMTMVHTVLENRTSVLKSIVLYSLMIRISDISHLELLYRPVKVKACYGQYPTLHDDIIKWKHSSGYWPFVSAENSLHKGQWRGALMFSLICTRINGWVNNGEAADLRRHRAHYDGIVMLQFQWFRAIWFNTKK